MRPSILIFAVIAIYPALVGAQEKTEQFNARTIKVLSTSATMRYHADYWVTVVSGVIGSEGIPETIRLGDKITVEDRTLTANYIFATRCLTRMEWAGEVLCEEGQISCVVVERPEDVPSEEERDRLWIHVKDCQPLE